MEIVDELVELLVEYAEGVFKSLGLVSVDIPTWQSYFNWHSKELTWCLNGFAKNTSDYWCRYT